MHQVELHVPAAPGELESALAFPIGQVAPALDDRLVGRRERPAEVRDKSQQPIEREPALAVAQVVEEDTPDAAPLVVPVRVDEVVIAPGLEAWVEGRVVAVADRLERPVEVHGVVGEGIGRREVGPPPSHPSSVCPVSSVRSK